MDTSTGRLGMIRLGMTRFTVRLEDYTKYVLQATILALDMPYIYSGAKTETIRKLSWKYVTHSLTYMMPTPPF